MPLQSKHTDQGAKQWVARNSGWSGLGDGGPHQLEKRGGGERVERSVVQQVHRMNQEII